MNLKKTVLIIPANDAEAVMILRLAEAMKLPTIISHQPHGASLDREPKIIQQIKDSGAERMVVVEMPGVKTEKKLSELGLEVVIIDHHHYQGLDRACQPKTKKSLPSSLEQFLKFFKITDLYLEKLGFDPRLVRGTGIIDRGFVWALQNAGYSESEIKKVIAYQKKIMRPFVDLQEEKKYEKAALEAWRKRTVWQEFFIVIDKTKKGLRPYLSLLFVQKFKHQTPLILDEQVRGVIYVQGSPRTKELFDKFGGFTFGEAMNWGYKNQVGQRKITLTDVKRELS
ncbi:MAG: hypothetical protein V1716_00305 [Candidatus Uhrbacteria bacterium]